MEPIYEGRIKPEVPNVVPEPPSSPSTCFVAAPFGRTQEEREDILGWYTLVVKPAIKNCGYTPDFLIHETAPSAINDEIRAKLVSAPMAIFDLFSGSDPSSPPNVNVMYELGFRHAFDKPLVLIGSEGQVPPFDIHNQRVLLERRTLHGATRARARLEDAIREASNGNYYRVLGSMKARALLDLAEQKISESSVLGAMLRETREMRIMLESLYPSVQSAVSRARKKKRRSKTPTISIKYHLRLRGEQFESEVKKLVKMRFQGSLGNIKKVTSQFLAKKYHRAALQWSASDWADYVCDRAYRFEGRRFSP